MKTKIEAAIASGLPFPKQYSETMLVLSKGKGVYLEDIEGEKYLDFGSGISVNALGYGRKDLAKIASRQMQKIIHVSNLYATEPAIELAERLLALGEYTAVHFGNSGSEANETALKYARLYAGNSKQKDKYKILCFENAFHGRTLGALSCTPNAKYQDPYRPLIPGVDAIPFNDTEALEQTKGDEYAALIVEVVQGEGGLALMTEEFANLLNQFCAEYDILLIADEIQTGLGRCGYALASEAVGLKPDMVTLSKPLAGGLPLSATLIPAKVNDLLHVGAHGTTFGGGPVTTAVANAVVDKVLDDDFLEDVREKGEYLAEGLRSLAESASGLGKVRGMGLLRGITVSDSPTERIPAIMASAKERGLLILRSGSDVIRIAPPLIIEKQEIDRGLILLKSSIMGE